MEPRIGIAAGMIKSYQHVPQRLLRHRLLSHLTFGSYTLAPRAGNPEPTTWCHQDGQWMLNAIGLKNKGLPDFVQNEMLMQYEACQGITHYRVSLAPTEKGDLKSMVELLNEHSADLLIDELEINGACPNHKKGEDIEPVLAYDMGATEALLAEAGDYRGAKAYKIAPRTPRKKLETIVELCAAYDITTIVSANTRKHTATIDDAQVLSVESGGCSGLPLLTDTMSQVSMLRNIIQDTKADLRIIACGGVLSASSAEVLLRQKGAAEVQVASLYWMYGEDGVYKLIEETAQRMTA